MLDALDLGIQPITRSTSAPFALKGSLFVPPFDLLPDRAAGAYVPALAEQCFDPVARGGIVARIDDAVLLATLQIDSHAAVEERHVDGEHRDAGHRRFNH